MNEPAAPAAVPQEDADSGAAIRRYESRMRPWRIAYAAGLVVAALVLLVIVRIAYSRGEISHVTLRTASSAPPSVSPSTPSPSLTLAWQTRDETAIGTPLHGGTVVTHDEHSVRGRDARTGDVRWSYTRTDRSVCAAIQTQGITVAVYRLGDNCDELTGLDTGTGQRKWTRTLDKDGHPVLGTPTYGVSSYTILFITPTVIYAIDPSGDQNVAGKSGGLDRWMFTHPDCTIHDAVLGTDGALISQTCTGRACIGQKFCGNGTQLLLRDARNGTDDDADTNNGNPDQIKWAEFGNDDIPASADQVVSAVSADGTKLTVYADKGAPVGSFALNGGTGTPTADALTDAEVIRFGGVTYAVQPEHGTLLWQAETAGLPTVTAPDGVGVPSRSRARLTVATSEGIATLDPLEGTVSQRFPAPAPPAESRVYPLGTGFLVTGTDTVAYR